MKTPESLPQTEGQWLDFYALLEVPVNATEDIIRKRIGQLYSEAAANSDHRDLSRRHYFQALVERVLPQCRRVLLDPEWRARYDRQHILHGLNDPSAQDYVSFIAGARGESTNATGDSILPARVQEEIKVAQSVVSCLQEGEALELLPSRAVKIKPGAFVEEKKAEPKVEVAPVVAVAEPEPEIEAAPVSLPAPAPIRGKAKKLIESEPKPEVRAQVLTAQEAADIRRRRASNPDGSEPFISDQRPDLSDTSFASPHKKKGRFSPSRIVIGEKNGPPPKRVLTPTALNLMVAITGVLLTITIQKFAATPAIATATARSPLLVSHSSVLEPFLSQAETAWEKTPAGAGFDVVLQATDAPTGLRRALGKGGTTPDIWIPDDARWSAKFDGAGTGKSLAQSEPIAKTPLVLIAQSSHAAELKKRFANHQIESWNALRAAVAANASGHFGISDPQKSEAGAMARASMATEWAASRNLTAQKALQNAEFWKWMDAFESESPATTTEMIKELALGTTGRFWWAIGTESEALGWMTQGKNLEIFYLPRTNYLDLPFCELERVGAGVETTRARADFERFLRSGAMQNQLRAKGFRPTEISLRAPGENNPFTRSDLQLRGVKSEITRPGDRLSSVLLDAIGKEWGKRLG